MPGGSAGAPDRLVEEGLLTLEGDEIAFAHALMREAVYGSLLKSRRRELHAGAAAWYAGRDPGLRAGHLAEAGDPGAARACIEAAAAEAESLRLDRALEFAGRACLLAREPADLCLARCLLGELQTRTGHTHDAIATLREVIDLRPDPLIEARARLALANALRILDRYDEALAALERAETVLAGLDRPELLARIWGLRGNIHFPRGELEACLMAHERALAWAQRAGSPVDEARAFGGVGDALYQRGRMRSARDHFRQCVAEAREHGAVGLALSNAPMLALTRAVCGEVREALEDCTAIAAEAVRFGDPRSELHHARHRGDDLAVPRRLRAHAARLRPRARARAPARRAPLRGGADDAAGPRDRRAGRRRGRAGAAAARLGARARSRAHLLRAVVPRHPGAAHAERGTRARAARAGRGAARRRLRQPQPPGVPPRGDGVRAAARRLPRDAPARGRAPGLHGG